MEDITMKSGIKDKNGVEVLLGHTIATPYVDPFGLNTSTEDSRHLVVFAHGAFGYYTETEFVPLMKWQATRSGEYVPNEGSRIEYSEQYPFWVVQP